MSAPFISQGFSQILGASPWGRWGMCSPHPFPALRHFGLLQGRWEGTGEGGDSTPAVAKGKHPASALFQPGHRGRGERSGGGPCSWIHSSYQTCAEKTKETIKMWLPNIASHTHYDVILVGLKTGITILKTIWQWLAKYKYICSSIYNGVMSG